MYSLFVSVGRPSLYMHVRMTSNLFDGPKTIYTIELQHASE